MTRLPPENITQHAQRCAQKAPTLSADANKSRLKILLLLFCVFLAPFVLNLFGGVKKKEMIKKKKMGVEAESHNLDVSCEGNTD